MVQKSNKILNPTSLLTFLPPQKTSLSGGGIHFFALHSLRCWLSLIFFIDWILPRVPPLALGKKQRGEKHFKHWGWHAGPEWLLEKFLPLLKKISLRVHGAGGRRSIFHSARSSLLLFHPQAAAAPRDPHIFLPQHYHRPCCKTVDSGQCGRTEKEEKRPLLKTPPLC